MVRRPPAPPARRPGGSWQAAGVTVMVVLLRGVNVSGRNRLAMADLRRVAEGCGCEGARTYIQSGNLVCSTPATTGDELAPALEAALADRSGVTADVMVRTRDELAAVVDRNPYLARGEGPDHLHVTFLHRAGDASLGLADPAAYLPDAAVAVGREVHLFLPGGLGRSKLAADLARRGPRGTTRNWRTVTRLLAMADEAT